MSVPGTGANFVCHCIIRDLKTDQTLRIDSTWVAQGLAFNKSSPYQRSVREVVHCHLFSPVRVREQPESYYKTEMEEKVHNVVVCIHLFS